MVKQFYTYLLSRTR